MHDLLDIDLPEIEIEPPTEPEEGDYILQPAGRLGARTHVSVYGETRGAFVVNAEDEALACIRDRMAADQFYPNVWRQDDHGGYTLIDPND